MLNIEMYLTSLFIARFASRELPVDLSACAVVQH